MSRSRKLRDMADNLPPINKITADGKIIIDSKGCAIKADHFSIMLNIKKQIQQKYKGAPLSEIKQKELQALGDYSVNMWLRHKRYLERKRRKMIQKAIPFIITAGIILYFLLR